MKTNIFKTFIFVLSFATLLSSCIQDSNVGPQGEPGLDGQVEIYYSQWYTPISWVDGTTDWYFDVTNPYIDEDAVEAGIILAYMSVPGDVYANAVRPMPAYALGANWDFLIPDYGEIEFTCDSEFVPGTANHFFRFVVIPSGVQIKSTKSTNLTKEELMKMPYQDVCKLLNIPE